MLTACGIETRIKLNLFKVSLVATVLTACGIETTVVDSTVRSSWLVATVLTACGIETIGLNTRPFSRRSLRASLQQCLPLAVLKRKAHHFQDLLLRLQQCLPLAVLKHEETHTEVTPAPEELQQCLPLAVLKHRGD